MRPVTAQEDPEFTAWLETDYVPIGGGDENAEGEGSEDQGSQGTEGEGAQDAESSKGPDAEDEKDDKGVSLKNRLAESERKREKAEREAGEARARADAYERSLGPDKRQTESATEDDDDTLLLTNPKAYREKLKSEVLQEVGKVRQEAQMKDFYEEYPELKNQASDEYEAVNSKYKALVESMGVNNIGVLRTAAEIVYSKRPKRKDDTRLSEPLGNGGSLPSQRGRKAEITPGRRDMMKKLGITDEKRIAEIYSRDLSEEIRVGG